MFFIVILISVSNILPRIIIKRKSHGRRNETTLYLRQKRYWKFPQKREHQTSTSRRASSLFWGSREKSRESSTRKEMRVRGAGWEARSLSSRLNFTSCLARYSFSWLFRSIVEPWRFCGLQALLVTDTIFSLPFWPRKVWNSFQQEPEADREFGKITRSHLNINCWRLFFYWPAPFQSSYFIGPYNLHYLLFSGIGALLCHHTYCVLSQSQTLFPVSEQN